MVLGPYKHFKGGKVKVLGIAKHSETLQEFVVYEHTDAKGKGIWVRPIEMFFGKVEVEGKKVPRFTPIRKKSRKKA